MLLLFHCCYAFFPLPTLSLPLSSILLCGILTDLLSSVQKAAESILAQKAYQIYPFPVNDGRRQLFDNDSWLAAADPDAPKFKPGHKVCISYNKQPDLFVVVAVAVIPGRKDQPTSTSASASDVTALTESLDTTSIASTAVDDDDDSQTVTDEATSAGDPTYLYLVVPLSNASAMELKDTVNLALAKTVLEKYLVIPPVFFPGRVLHIPINKWGSELVLPVEIKKVKRGKGLTVGNTDPATRLAALQLGRETGLLAPTAPWSRKVDVWNYKFTHGSEWVCEDAVVDLVGGDFGGVWG